MGWGGGLPRVTNYRNGHYVRRRRDWTSVVLAERHLQQKEAYSGEGREGGWLYASTPPPMSPKRLLFCEVCWKGVCAKLALVLLNNRKNTDHGISFGCLGFRVSFFFNVEYHPMWELLT